MSYKQRRATTRNDRKDLKYSLVKLSDINIYKWCNGFKDGRRLYNEQYTRDLGQQNYKIGIL